jgi:hypothetical protein
MSTLEFVTKEGASREEIYAAVSRGYDAMMNGATDVVFSIDGPGHISPTKATTKKVKIETGEGHNVLNNTEILEVVEDMVSCPGCEEHPCVFTQHKDNLVAYDEAEHPCLPGGEDMPENNLRRKKLYRQLTLMINEGPLGAKVRRPLPSCCVTAIREMLPSDTYMGFREE